MIKSTLTLKIWDDNGKPNFDWKVSQDGPGEDLSPTRRMIDAVCNAVDNAVKEYLETGTDTSSRNP